MANKDFHKNICKAALPYYPSDGDLSFTNLFDSQDTIISSIRGQCEFVQCLSATDEFTDGIKESIIYNFIESILRQIEVMSVVNDQMYKEAQRNQ